MNKIINYDISNINSKISDLSLCESYEYQVYIVNCLVNKLEFPEKKQTISRLMTKINSYKQQDKKRDLYEKGNTITLEQLINKLYSSKVMCYYCNNNVLILYNNKYDKNQWTLDRINNYDEHTCENCRIACLSCNLKRRRINSEKFKFTRQLTIVKQ